MRWTNRYNIPEAIVEAITKDDYQHNTDPMAISVTSLIDSPKIRVLKRLHADEMEEDVSDTFWRFFGSMAHLVMERIKGKDRIVEIRLEEEINGFKLTGKPDMYDPIDKAVIDYKVTSVWSYVFASEKQSWENQLNVYAYLIRGLGYEVKELRNDMFLRDHRKSEYIKSPDSYPPIPYAGLKQKLWGDAECEHYIFSRLDLHRQAMAMNPDDIICTPEERWTKPTTYACYTRLKNGEQKKRADRVYDTMQKAQEHQANNPGTEIVIRPGEDTRCMSYCSVAKWCNHAKNIKKEMQNELEY